MNNGRPLVTGSFRNSLTGRIVPFSPFEEVFDPAGQEWATLSLAGQTALRRIQNIYNGGALDAGSGLRIGHGGDAAAENAANDTNNDVDAVNVRTEWKCGICTCTLDDKLRVRCLIRCGHVMCEKCAPESLRRCPICKAKVEEIITPKIECGDPIDHDAEDEKCRIEIAKAEEQVRKASDELDALVAVTAAEKATLYNKLQKLQNEDEEKKRLIEKQKTDAIVVQQKLEVINFLSSIEHGREFNMPTTSTAINLCEMAAKEAQQHMKMLTKQKEKALTNHQFEQMKLNQETIVLEEAIVELYENSTPDERNSNKELLEMYAEIKKKREDRGASTWAKKIQPKHRPGHLPSPEQTFAIVTPDSKTNSPQSSPQQSAVNVESDVKTAEHCPKRAKKNITDWFGKIPSTSNVTVTNGASNHSNNPHNFEYTELSE